MEILKKEIHKKTNVELFYLRTSNKSEIDLIIDRKKYKELIEIKMTSTFKTKMIETIKQFMEVKDKGYLLYNGESFQYSNNINVMNYADYLNKS